MRYLLLALSLLLWQPAAARVDIGIGISVPGLEIGINMPRYPRLIRVPDYPVYYAPDVELNFFFYDGLYWVLIEDDWYASSWYNGPWWRVDHVHVPLFILRVPVRYYRRPPPYFRPWHHDRPPRWEERWGREWHEHRRDWDKWDRHSVPPPAPLPYYQRSYEDRYPHERERQRSIEREKYRYQPREEESRRHYRDDDRGRGRDDDKGRGRDDDRGGRDDHRR